MFERSRNQYIFKLSNGKTINIFFKDSSSLHMSVLNKRNLWTESVLLTKDCFQGFSADIDKYDRIHILYQDRQGNLIKGLVDTMEWTSKIILNSKNALAYDKHLKILCNDNNVYMFYIVEYSGNKLLSFQTQKHGDFSSAPKVIDYVEDIPLPYIAFLGADGQPKVLYNSSDSRHKALGLLIFDASKNMFGDFLEVEKSNDAVGVLGALEDRSGKMHFLWSSNNGNHYNLCYKELDLKKETIQEKRVISSAPMPFTNSALVISNGLIIAYWCNDLSVYCTYSPNGERWSNYEKYIYFDGKPFYCITFKSLFDNVYNSIIACELPGNFTNGYRLGFTDTFPIKGMNPIPTFNSLESPIPRVNKVDESSTLLKEISKRLQDIEQVQKQYSTDISKITIKMDFIEDELSKLKSQYSAKDYSEVTLHEQVPLREKDSESMVVNYSPSVDKEEYPITKNFDSSDKSEKPPTSTFTSRPSGPNAPISIATSPTPNGFKSFQSSPSFSSNKPLMPGNGFSIITPEFLYSQNKKNNA